MIITFTNVIGAIRNAISSVITTNLKMWLGFETSEILGSEMVTNGDFATASGWSGLGANGWSISNDKARVDYTSPPSFKPSLSQTIGTEVGKTYKISFKVSDYVDGKVKVLLGFGSTPETGLEVTANGVYELITTPNVNNPNILFISVRDNITELSIDYISVKEVTQITPDKSGNNNVGELFTGKALEFDGVNDKVDFTSFTTPIKCAVFWVKPLSTDTEESILGFGGFQAGSKYIKSSNNSIITQGFDSVSVYVNNVQTTSVPLNQWSRVVVNFALKTPQDLTFGYGFATYGYIQLSDVQLYNENLTTDDIAYDYANPQNLVTDRSGTSIVLSNLKGYWALSEGAGSLAYDSSGEGNNGTISGATYELAQTTIPQLGMMNFSNGAVATGVTLIPDPNNPTLDIDGNAVRDRLNSFNLDGSGYAEVAEVVGLDVTDFSIEAWVKFDYTNSGSTTNVIYVNGGSSVDVNTFALTTDEDNKVRFIVGGTIIKSTTVFSNNNWVHIVGTRESGAIKLYINGNTTPEATGTSGAAVNNALDLLVGRDTNTNRFYKERISDVRLYGTDLDANEVENNYNAGLSAHTN